MDVNSKAIASDLSKKISGEVLFDDISRVLFSTAACMYQIKPLGVVIPKTLDDVIFTVKYCRENSIPLTGRGAGTSLAGQSIGHGIVLVFNKYFRNISDIDPATGSVRVEPGVVLSELNNYAAKENFMFGPDPSSGKQCTIGGMIGTNAAGAHTVKYGATKDNLLELEVITANGELTKFKSGLHSPSTSLEQEVFDLISPSYNTIKDHFPHVAKNSSGYNLLESVKPEGIDPVKLICGSEGTLGIVVSATLKLVPLPSAKSNLIAYFKSYYDAGTAARESLKFSPAAVEMLDKTFARAAIGIDPDIDSLLKEDFVSILIFEFEEETKEAADRKIGALVEELKRLKLSDKIIVPRSKVESAKLWRIRKEASAIFYRIEEPGKKTSFVDDVAVPVEKFPDYLLGVQKIFSEYRVDYALYGHAGSGNTHAIALLDLKNPDHIAKIDPISSEVYNLTISLGGTLSGEHGDGLLRTPFLERLYGKEVYSLFKKVKDIFDPPGILNPGKIVDLQETSIVHDLRYGSSYHRVKTGTSLDNEEVAHEIEKCHGCGVCLSYCPTALATNDERATPRAKGNMLRAIISGNLSIDYLENYEFKSVLDYCFNCKLCLTECPTAIDIPGIVIEAKTTYIRKTEPTGQDKFINRLPVFSAAASVFPPLSNIGLNLPVIRKPLEKLYGIDARRKLPAFHKPLYKRFGLQRKLNSVQRKVVYFPGCFANFNDVNGEGIATIEVLRRNKIDVRIPDTLRCCGIAKITTGNVDAVMDDASWNVAELYRYVADGFDVVFSAPSCGLAVKDDYPKILQTEEAAKVAEHVFELPDYLYNLYMRGELNTNFGPVKKRITYHNPCHSVPMGIADQPLKLLRLVPELEVVELSEDKCCGMAGTFGMKKQFYDLSLSIGESLFSQIERLSVDEVVTTCGTCNIQITQGTGRNVVHLAKILYESYKSYQP
ncbi:MAG: anaerobic glycerol-3-phosphate dehydrogenase subunit C [Candidatus Kryptoniota bacterium]